MAATLNAPLTLDPQTASKLVVRRVVFDFDNRAIITHVDMVDSNGKTLQTRSVVAEGAQVQAYIDNQESDIYSMLLAKLGVTGTVKLRAEEEELAKIAEPVAEPAVEVP